MRRGVSAAAAAALLVVSFVVVLVIGTNGPAWADCPPDPVDETGICLSDTLPGDPGGTDPGDPGDTGGGPGGPACPGAPNGICVNATDDRLVVDGKDLVSGGAALKPDAVRPGRWRGGNGDVVGDQFWAHGDSLSDAGG